MPDYSKWGTEPPAAPAKDYSAWDTKPPEAPAADYSAWSDKPVTPGPTLPAQAEPSTPFPQAEDRNTVQEDVRRAGEWLGELPGRAARGAMNVAEKVTDMPITRMYARAKMDATGKAPPNEYLDKALPTQQDAIRPHGGPDYTRDPANTLTWDKVLSSFDTEGNRNPDDTPPDLHADIGVPGTDVSARQVINAASHATVARGAQAFQRGPGQVIGQVGMALARPIIENKAPYSYDLGSEPDFGSFPEPGPASNIGPESKEMLARELLSFYAGPDFQMGFDTKKYKTASDQLEQEYGTNGAAFAQSFAHELGGLPVYLLSTGAGELAASGDAALAGDMVSLGVKGSSMPAAQAVLRGASVKAGVAEGAAQGYLQGAAKDGEDVFTTAGYGALLGGVIGWGAGVAGVRGQVKAMSQARDNAVMMSRATTNDFLKELDDVIAKKRAPSFEALVSEGERSPDFDIKVISGKPAKPTGSYVTLDDKGQLVMREFEVRAVRKTKRTVSTPSTEVPVYSKWSTTPVRTVNPKGTSVGDGLQVRITAYDTPITDLEKPLPAGRRMIPGMVSTEAQQQLMELATKATKETPGQVGGTVGYVPPETWVRAFEAQGMVGDDAIMKWHARERALQDMKANLEKLAAEHKRVNPVAGNNNPTRPPGGVVESPTKNEKAPGWSSISTTLKPSPMLVHVDGEGRLTTTVISPAPPREPTTWKFHAGDTAKLDGHTDVTVKNAQGDIVTVNIPGAGDVDVPKSSLTYIPKEFYKPAHGGNPLIGAAPSSLDGRTEALIRGTEGGIGVPDVMKMAGKPDPAWAAKVLRDLEAKGHIKETSPGIFEPTAKGKPSSKENPGPGYAAFIGTGGVNDRGQIAIIRGKDPRSPNNWLVEKPDFRSGETTDPVAGSKWAKTKMESVPEDAIRSMRPVGLADKKKVDPAIDMYGWTKPMPPQFLQMSKATQGDQELLTREWNRTATTPGLIQRSAQALKEAFGGAMHTAAIDIRKSKAQTLFSNAGMMKSEGLGRTQFLANRLKLGTQASEDMTKVLLAERSRSPSGATSLNAQELNQWVAKYPAEAKACLDDFKKMVKEGDDYSQFLASRGVANIDNLEHARAMGLEDEYLTRVYQAFMMPRTKWADYARKNLTLEWDSALEWMYANRPNHNFDFGHTSAEMDEILRLDNPIQALQEKGYIKAEGSKKLLAREQVPGPIRALLGEHKDAAVRLGFSVAYQRQVVKAIQAWDSIAAHPTLWSPGWRPDMTLRVPNRPVYGQAANGFVPDNLTTRSLLGDRPLSSMAEPNAFLRATGWLGRQWKAAHTVYNQVSWVNNAVRNVKGVILSGGLLSPEDWQGFRDAASMLMDYHKDPTIYGPNKLLIEAMDFDAVGPGLAGTELSHEQRAFSNKMLRIFNKPRNSTTPFLDALAEARDSAMGVPEKIHNGYDFTDKLAKFGSYLNIRRRLIAEGRTVDDAAALASLRVNQSFQNFPRSPVKGMATNISLMAPFLSSKMEDVRINATAVARVLKGDESDLIFRLVGAGALFGSATYLANSIRRGNGISDEQDEKDRQSIPLRVHERHPFLVGSLDHDPHGRRTFMDITPYEDLLNSFRGNLQDPILAKIIFNNAEDIVGQQSLAGDVVQGVGAWSGALHPTAPPMNPRPDQAGPLGLAAQYGQGFVPQGLIGAYHAAQSMNPSGRMVNPEGLTGDQAFMKGLTGRPTVVTGPQTTAQTAMERAQRVRESAKNVGAAATDAALSHVSRERQKYMIQSTVRELQKAAHPYPRPLKSSTTK